VAVADGKMVLVEPETPLFKVLLAAMLILEHNVHLEAVAVQVL
tara:strand:+ start:1364 stop:1492 length:129 start_codon:yes stop_codon:yes gene_type:complete